MEKMEEITDELLFFQGLTSCIVAVQSENSYLKYFDQYMYICVCVHVYLLI